MLPLLSLYQQYSGNKALLLIYLASHLLVFAVSGQVPEQRVAITTITPSLPTAQSYSPWLNDNLGDLVQNDWSPNNFRYLDLTLTLAHRTIITRLSLYDGEGVFTEQPAALYALDGTQRTLLGIFTGQTHQQWIELIAAHPVMAEAIIVRKFSNNIPQKIKVYGRSASTYPPPVAQASITFASLASAPTNSAPFNLVATSNNTTTPITFFSSDSTVTSVSNATGRWQATVGREGTAIITAKQVGNASYAAANVSQRLVVTAATTPSEGKIPIEPKRWYQLTNAPDGIQSLFDGITNVRVPSGYGRVTSPFDSYYPLRDGEEFSIENIKFFDGEGNNLDAPMTLSIITATWQRIPIATFTGTQYNQWVGPYPDRPTVFTLNTPIRDARFLVLTTAWAYPNEIELYGSYTVPAPVEVPSPSTLAASRKVQFRQSVGINAFEWDLEDGRTPWEVDTVRLKAVKNFSGIRHYIDWEKLESVQGGYTFNPVHSGGWNYDAMYERLKSEGIEVLACLKTVPGWLLATYPAAERDAENVPVAYGQDFTLPSSYLEQAKVAFQFVARYGNNPSVDRTLLSVNSSPRWNGDGINQVKVGLNLIKYIECDNERDKWWKGRKAYQTAFEYAANLSAFYDGHKKTMGPGTGVKNADPAIQVVMAGLAAPTPDYVKGMVDWCRQHRGYNADGSVNLCWDVINYHLYSNDASTSQNGISTRGKAPEVAEAGQVAKDFVLMAHQYAGNMPVWITETGYDLNQGSPLKAIAIGNRSVLETQADWLLRTALAYARWGIERVFFYQLYDDNPSNPIQFGSSGLIGDHRLPRPAAQYLNQANKLIGAYTYKETVNNDPLVDRFELNGKSAYVLVVPDELGRTAQYTLDLGSAPYADVYRPSTGRETMTEQRVALQNGQLHITVTETPVFVLPPRGPSTPSACSATGTILHEQWLGVNGSSVTDIPTTTSPASKNELTSFESLANVGDNYGRRIRGYICPPQSGYYTFWIAGDDDCELWLSTDEQPEHRFRIAKVAGWTNPRQWLKFDSQKSLPQRLEAGQKYYIEALQKEEWGEDHVAVAWQLPDNTLEGPIPGTRLSPYLEATANKGTTASANSSTSIADVTTATRTQEAELTAAPNPFTNESYVQFKLEKSSQAKVDVYDMQGRLVREVFSGLVEAGRVQGCTIKATGLPKGVYNIQLTTGKKVLHRRIAVL